MAGRNGIAETKKVRVSYVSRGFGLALAIADTAGTPDDDGADGLLHISDACVTLELPSADGSPSLLTWDPAEVDWESMAPAR